MADHPLHGPWTSFVINKRTITGKPDGKFNLKFVSGQFEAGDHEGKPVSCPHFSNTEIKLLEEKREYEGEIKATVFGNVKVIVGTVVIDDEELRIAGQQDGIWIATQP